MGSYRANQKTSDAITGHLTDMEGVLREITVTYEVLLELLRQQEQALQAPTLNRQRNELQQLVEQAAATAVDISDATRQHVLRSRDLTQRIVALDQQIIS